MRWRGKSARFLFSLFVCLALYLSILINVRNFTTIFIAFLAVAWFVLANQFCAWISSYRFQNPQAKYIEINHSFIRKIFVRRFCFDGVYSTSKSDNRTNIIGLVLNIINTLIFVASEILLLIPEIPCAPHTYYFAFGSRRARSNFELELDSLNEIIAAEAPRAFMFLATLICVIFIGLFEHHLNEHRKKIKRENKSGPTGKKLKNTKWYYQLYTSLTDMAVHRNNKKHKFWYDADQLEKIEDLVTAATKNAEIKLERRGDKPVSFTVVDTLNDHTVFRGFFKQ